jgi:hypothetical protein
MKETTPSAMRPCFEKWCCQFDDVFSHQAQKKGFRQYPSSVTLRENNRQKPYQSINTRYLIRKIYWLYLLLEKIWRSLRIQKL